MTCAGLNFRLLLVLCLVPLAVVSTHAQTANLTDTSLIPTPGTGHNYVQLLNETVNPANGTLNLNISFPTPQLGPGPTMPIGMTYNSNSVMALGAYHTSANLGLSAIQYQSLQGLSGGGWSILEPYVTVTTNIKSQETAPNTPLSIVYCHYYSDYTFVDETGQSHALQLSYPARELDSPADSCSVMSPQPLTVISGSDTEVQATLSNVGTSLLIRERNGTQYNFNITPSSSTGQIATGVFYYNVTDHNNIPGSISYTQDNKSSAINGMPITLPDSVSVAGEGKPYILSVGIGSTYSPNGSGASTPWDAGFKNAGSNNSSLCGPQGVAPFYPSPSGSLTLPNEQSYQFEYDTNYENYGMIHEITYPSGGTITYSWAVNPASEVGQWADAYGNTDLGCVFTYGVPAISKRVVSYDGVTPALEQDYSYTTTWSASTPYDWTSKTTTIITKDCARAAGNCAAAPSYTTIYTYSGTSNPIALVSNDPNTVGPFGADTIQETPAESMIQYYDWNGSLLQTVAKTWWDFTHLKSVQTTLANGQVSLITYPNLWSTEVGEQTVYDWGAGTHGPLLSQTVVPLRPFAGRLSTAYIPASKSTYNSAGILIAQTQYTYDQYPASQPGLPTLTGNLTSETQCLIVSGACASDSPRTIYSYDALGHVISMTDPRGNITSYSYADNPAGSTNTYAHLTQITYPQTNGVVHQESFAYNYATGILVSSTDENSQTTNYTYNDPLLRITNTQGPPDPNNGGQSPTTSYLYSDSSPSPSVTTSQLLNTSGQMKASVAVMDGMGHATQSQLTTDSSGPDYVVTTYDGLGNVYTVSNPYRTTSDSTYGVITSTYDALGRKTGQVDSDGVSTQTWNYIGNTVIYTDENGNKWQRTTDALGRLTKVLEPNGTSQSPSMETDYSYDALNNLTLVTQSGGANGLSGARARSFGYDSLSRLVTSSNPESGVLTYVYDANGNLMTKTDARNVITSYSYDALNRLLSKTYSNDASQTPFVCYQYDLSSVAYSIGRLSNQWTKSASTGTCSSTLPTSGYLTRRSIVAYDPMGRIQSEQQCTPATCTSGTPYSPAYTYDLAGNLLTSTNGIATTPTVNTLSFTNTFDTAGRLQTVKSNWNNDALHPGTLFSAQSIQSTQCPQASSASYAPFGGLMNAVFGNGLTLAKNYDKRLRPVCEIGMGSIVASPTAGSATVTITGFEQTK